MQTKTLETENELDLADDIDAHAFDCNCDECCENLYLMMQEDRA